MTSTTWTDAPAGFAGPGSVALLPFACPSVAGGAGVVMAPLAAPIQGSGVPVAVRLRSTDERGAAHESFLQRALAFAGTAPLSAITDNNGTTLGIHSPGRPQS